MDSIGEKLKDFFKEKNITQVQVANMTGVDQPYVAALLNNKKKFGKKAAQKWGDIFGISPSWLLTGEGEMMKPSVFQNNQNGDNINGQSVTVNKSETDKFIDTIKECHELLRKKDEQIDRLLTLLERK
jgi:transcriptional regulator with XRE-family HTH domain|nr:MAG TPA: Regulatory protein [Caudoviricetes sp.]